MNEMLNYAKSVDRLHFLIRAIAMLKRGVFMREMPGPMKDEKGRPTRKAASLKRWNCK
jgi:hypothetical protein